MYLIELRDRLLNFDKLWMYMHKSSLAARLELVLPSSSPVCLEFKQKGKGLATKLMTGPQVIH
jgi:hypothetical protein